MVTKETALLDRRADPVCIAAGRSPETNLELRALNQLQANSDDCGPLVRTVIIFKSQRTFATVHAQCLAPAYRLSSVWFDFYDKTIVYNPM